MKKYETQNQLAELEDKRRILITRINKWCKVQLSYIPEIGSLVANTASKLLSAALTAEDVPLFLPSSLLPNLQTTPGFQNHWPMKFNCALHRQMMHWQIFDTTCALSLVSGSLKRSILVELEISQIPTCTLYSTALTIT